ncbi:hypothetical protein LJR034_000838 [Caballeronia sp. LjRoot34]|uniref:hypothetical protein n=1 Tax=Caballeronia sp. LjRoot34 TaxID=3342325 RepID=UPI003ECC4DE4
MIRKQLKIGQLVNVGFLKGARVIADVARAAGYIGDTYVVECGGQLYELAAGQTRRISMDEAVALPKQFKAKQIAKQRAHATLSKASITMEEAIDAMCALTA